MVLQKASRALAKYYKNVYFHIAIYKTCQLFSHLTDALWNFTQEQWSANLLQLIPMTQIRNSKDI